MKDEIHSVIFAVVDENGLLDARVIDIMLVDSDSLYFITAKRKCFLERPQNCIDAIEEKVSID